MKYITLLDESSETGSDLACQNSSKLYNIKTDSLKSFQKSLNDSVLEGNYHYFCWNLTRKCRNDLEKENYVRRFVIDIDLKRKYENEVEVELWNFSQIEKLVNILRDRLKDINPNWFHPNSRMLDFYILVKDPRIVNQSVKHGLHVEFKNLFMTNIDLSLVIEKLQPDFEKIFPYFKSDIKFMFNDWLLFGGRKLIDGEHPYTPRFEVDSKGKISTVCIASKKLLRYESYESFKKNLGEQPEEEECPNFVEMFWPGFIKGKNCVFRLPLEYHFSNLELLESKKSQPLKKIYFEADEETDIEEEEFEETSLSIEIQCILNGLPQRFVDMTKEWRSIIAVLVALSKNEEKEIKRIARKWSETTSLDNYSDEGFNREWTYWKHNSTLEFEHAKNLLRWKSNHSSKIRRLLVEQKQQSLAELAFLLWKDDFFLKKGEFYYYCTRRMYWIRSQNFIADYLTTKLSGYIKDYFQAENKSLRSQLKRQLELMVIQDKEKLKDDCERKTKKNEEQNFKIQNNLKNFSFMTGVVKFLSSEWWDFEELPFNRHPELIPLNNDLVIDLSSSQIRPRKKDDFLDFNTGRDLNYDTERAHRFILDFCNGKEERVKPISTLFLYFLSGLIFDRRFYQFVGDGCNGKSTMLNILSKLSGGDKIGAVGKHVIVHHRDHSENEMNPSLTAMSGMRSAFVVEPGSGSKINVEIIKKITGGDEISTRTLYSKPIKFKCQAKLVVATNYMLEFKTLDKALEKRLAIIPCEKEFEIKAEEDFFSKDFLDQFLTFCYEQGKDEIKKCIESNTQLNLSGFISEMTADIISNLNPIPAFLEVCTVQGENLRADRAQLWNSFKLFLEENRDEYAINVQRKDFNKYMVGRFGKACMSNGIWYYKGLEKKSN